jgi:hypothetical protein
MAFEQTSVKPFCHRPKGRRDDPGSRDKAQPIMATRTKHRDTQAEYMTVRQHRKKTSLQTGKGPYMTVFIDDKARRQPGDL